MAKSRTEFPYYEEIDDFLESITSSRSKTPLLCCFRLKGKVDQVRYKPPYRKGFYTIILVTNSGSYKLNTSSEEKKSYNSFLVFQSPGQLMSYRYTAGMHTKGYLICFKPELFSFLKKSFIQDFSYLDMLQTEAFELENSNLAEVESAFEEVFTTYEKEAKNYEKIASLKLLVLQYLLKEVCISEAKAIEEKVQKGQGGEVVFQKFLQLVEIHYIDKRTVNEYADLLAVSPSYLSVQIKKHSNKGALSFINQRVINEAMSFIEYTDYNINEVAQQLRFSDTSNFVKFFKKHTGKTPVEFKKDCAPEKYA